MVTTGIEFLVDSDFSQKIIGLMSKRVGASLTHSQALMLVIKETEFMASKNKLIDTTESDVYKQPQDVLAIKKMFQPSTREFSIELIKCRYRKMAIEDQLRGDRTIIALTTGQCWDKVI